jgi:predicted nucleotide-binding protein with TIR-like domain
MTRRPTVPPRPQPADRTVDQMRRRIDRLKKRITELKEFDPQSVQMRWSPEAKALEAAIKEALEVAFGHNTIAYKRYEDAARLDTGPLIARMSTYGRAADRQDAQEARQYLATGKQKSLVLLQQAIKGLQEEIADLESLTQPDDMQDEPQRDLSKVFVVHGHDEGAREAVARFLERLGIRPVILHEQASQGGTVIEKVEAHGEVGFAVILLTPDDLGCVKGGTPTPRAAKRAFGTRILHWPARPKACVRPETRRGGNSIGFWRCRL